MLYAGLTNIRDCIAFPKTARGTDLMTGAPGTVDARQLRELHVRSEYDRDPVRGQRRDLRADLVRPAVGCRPR